jgi:hypothetical protein
MLLVSKEKHSIIFLFTNKFGGEVKLVVFTFETCFKQHFLVEISFKIKKIKIKIKIPIMFSISLKKNQILRKRKTKCLKI